MGMFDEFAPAFSTEAKMKSGMDSDGLKTSDPDPGNMFADFTKSDTTIDYKKMADEETAKLLKRDRGRLTDESDTGFRRTPGGVDYKASPRFSLNFREGLHGSIAGQAMDRAEAGMGDLAFVNDKIANEGVPQEKLDEIKANALEKLKAYKGKRAGELAEYYNLPDWYKDEDFVDRLGKMSTSFAGQLAGGIASPENMMPMSKGGNLFKTFLKGFAANAPAGAVTDLMDQQMNVELGLQKEVNWNQVMTGGVTGGSTGAMLNVGLNHGRIVPRTIEDKAATLAAKTFTLPADDTLATKQAAATQPAPLEPTKDSIVLTNPSSDKMPGLFDEFKTEPSIDEAQAKTFPPEEPPLPEINAEEAKPVRDTTTSDLPGLFDDFKHAEGYPPVEHPVKSLDESQSVFENALAEAQRLARVDQVMDVPSQDNHGFGPDVTEAQQSPYLAPNQADIAAGSGGATDQMAFMSPQSAEIRDLILRGQQKPEVAPPAAPIKDVEAAVKEEPVWTPATVADAVTTGQPVPKEVLDQYPALKELQKARVELAKGRSKNQGGYIDPEVFAEGFRRLFGFSSKNTKAFAEKLKASYTEFKDPADMANYVVDNGIQDLKVHGDFVNQNQLAQIAQDNKVVTFTFNHLFDAMRSSDARVAGYDKALAAPLQWVHDNPRDAVDLFRQWEYLNANPALAPIRAQIAGDPAALKQYLVSKGVKPEAIDAMKPFMDVMNDLHGADTASLAKHGRGLDSEPLYFPLGRNGPYHFVVTDDTGAVRYYGGHLTLSEAKKTAMAYEKSAPDGWNVSPVEQTDPTQTVNSAITEALRQGAPDWLRNVAYAQYTKRIEYRRNFEQGRSDTHEIGGYVGELQPKTDAEYNDMLKDFLDTVSHRVKESHHLENAGAAVEIAKSLLSDTSVLQDKYPRTYAWLNTEISRHIGVDISALPTLDRILNHATDPVTKVLTKLDSIREGYELNPGDNVFPPYLTKAMFQGFSWFASAAKIMLNPNVIMSNWAQIGTIGLEGVRNAFRTGVSPLHAVNAQIKTLAYMATFGQHPEFADIKQRMIQASKEGIIDPHGNEAYSVVENLNKDGPMATLDKIGQWPRNIVEKQTNYVGTLYYNFFVDSAFPHLDPLERDQTVYNMTRSFTGDYSQAAALFAFGKAGTSGYLGSQFAKWKFNRTSRYLDDIIMASRMDKYGVRGVLPLLTSFAIGGIMAGAYGEIGAVDYEAVRQLGTATGLWDWKPLSAVVGETLDEHKVPPGFVRTTLQRGVLTAFSDWAAQKYGGESSGPDVSGSIRESSILETPGVAVSYAHDIGKGVGAILLKASLSRQDVTDYINSMPEGSGKNILKKMTMSNSFGVTTDDKKNLVKALPTIFQEAAKQGLGLVEKIPQEDGTDHYLTQNSSKDEGNFERDNFQQNLALAGGLKTTEERNFNEGKSYFNYLTKTNKDSLTEMKDGLYNNLDNPYIVDRNAKLILQEHGQQALESTIQGIKDKHNIKTQGDFFTLQEMAALKTRDQIAAAKAIERIQQALAVARPRTSVDR